MRSKIALIDQNMFFSISHFPKVCSDVANLSFIPKERKKKHTKPFGFLFLHGLSVATDLFKEEEEKKEKKSERFSTCSTRFFPLPPFSWTWGWIKTQKQLIYTQAHTYIHICKKDELANFLRFFLSQLFCLNLAGGFLRPCAILWLTVQNRKIC